MIAVPESEEGLARAIGEAHRRYTRRINFREKWRGHLWQERFASFPMDENYLLATARYVEMNPVAAGIVECPGGYQWSSARAHLMAQDDKLVKVEPLRSIVENWSDFLSLSSEEEMTTFRKHERSGRPLGDEVFVENIEASLARTLRPQKPGPKQKAEFVSD